MVVVAFVVVVVVVVVDVVAVFARVCNLSHCFQTFCSTGRNNQLDLWLPIIGGCHFSMLLRLFTTKCKNGEIEY